MFCFQGVKYKNILDVPELEIPEDKLPALSVKVAVVRPPL